ncbi:hypothetical protein LCGC14_2119040 [marine sediment metagenome]|uniref:Uncharacterized protein n=1 Tax=marine sediment metagenome TaxID=412755 RepID=A0A0F9GHX2_9ZZZZ
MAVSPWSSGPGEILQHGLSLLRVDSDANRRLAMLSIDNAVELMIKTYLGLPKRVTGLNISRSKYAEFSESFPKLLDAIEEYSSDKLDGIDLGEIEWYHRLRNQLYHQGNGLTVELEKAQVYAALAKLLFENLFDNELDIEEENVSESRLGAFLAAWVTLEQTVQAIWSRLLLGESGHRHLMMRPTELVKRNVIKQELAMGIDRLRRLRNGVVHGEASATNDLSDRDIEDVKEVTAQLQEVLDGLPDETGEE